MKIKKISVIIPTYNSSGTIGECLDSILRLKYKNLEIIVVDDCSFDNTVEIVKKYKCKVIKQDKNQGPAAARNRGARKARGDILLFFDSDIVMYPDTIRNIAETLQDQSIASVIGIYSSKPLNKGYFQEYYCLFKYYSLTYAGISEYDVFGSYCAAIRRDVFISVGGFKKFKWGIDVENEELGRRIAEKYRMIINPDIKVKHKFPGFKKLLITLMKRTFWWTIFFFKYSKFQKGITTFSFGSGTVCAPASLILLISVIFIHDISIRIFLAVISFFSLLYFLRTYKDFYKLCLRKKGVVFFLKSVISSYFFSFAVTLGGIEASLYYFILKFSGKDKNIFKL